MRVVVGATLVLSALGLAAIPVGCGTSTDTSNIGGTGGEGASGTSTGGSGHGGQGCVPATETCDGVDNNCDGVVDEGCACTQGDTQPCYTGDAGTEGVGECKGGTQTCDATGAFGACAGEVKPIAEICNNKDDDCNGAVDDKPMLSCGVGACAATAPGCLDGQDNTCTPGQPSLEICDGIDNDCDQEIDESFPNEGAACTTGNPGVCGPGLWVCTNGVEVCDGQNMGSTEQCNGLDDDCDGVTDNNVPGTGGACSTGQNGECSAGIVDCQNNVIDCFPINPSVPEICDGLDNDCDGTNDNGDPGSGAVCQTGQPGLCATGVEHCVGGAITCVPDAQITPETCNGLDDNCNGTVDDGNPGGGLPCGCGGTTACVGGATVCQGGPTTYFYEDFHNNSQGWTLDTTWQIGPAAVSNCPSGNDPAQDHTATADNGVAGVVIGGCAPTNLHDFYWMTSPVFNTSGAVGSVYLQFWRWLTSDYTPYMQNKIQISTNGGATWTDLPYGTTGSCCGVQDTAWTNHPLPGGAPALPTNSAQYPTQFDISAYKSANTRIRFGYNIASGGVYTIGSWNLDDVLVASAICP